MHTYVHKKILRHMKLRAHTRNTVNSSGKRAFSGSLKRELKTRPIYECRCDERLKTKVEESTRLSYTGLLVELEHLKIKTTLIDEMFASVMDEYVFLK
jgi:hypothetical protein